MTELQLHLPREIGKGYIYTDIHQVTASVNLIIVVIRYGGYYTGQADANVYFDQSDSGHFNNSISEYSSQYGLRTSSSPVVISSSSFNNNSDDGIYASSGELQIDNCQFNNNGNYAAYLINVDVKTLLKQFGQREFYRSIWFKWDSS